jgi:glutamate carboxypeptidase
VAEALLPHLIRLGFTVEKIPQAPLPPEMSWVEEVMIPGQRQEELGPTYWATREGIGDRRILLLGDLDTAFPRAESRTSPFRREGSHLFGPGIADMKGGLVIIVAALETLYDLDIATPPIDLVLSGDEQAGSLGSREVIERAATRCTWALCVECARNGGKLMAGRGHIGIGEMVAEGREAHAGSAFEYGINAIDTLARVIPEVNALSTPDKGVLVAVTLIEGGRRRSVIPDRARAILDIRTPSARDWETAMSRLGRIVADYGQDRIGVRTHAHRPGVLRTTQTEKLLAAIAEVGDPLGVEIEAFRSPAAGSSAFAVGCVVMDGMGPIGESLMTPNESIEIASVPERAAILAGTMQALGAWF